MAAVTTRTIRHATAPADGRRDRRAAWIAMQLRDTYGTGWLPRSVADRIVRIEIIGAKSAVVLHLFGGTKLIDRRDRIDSVGAADDIAVEELAEAVQRRGWKAVVVEGDPEFRIAGARRLVALRPPVHVMANPLSEFEIAEILDAGSPALPPAFSPPAPSPRRGRPQGGGEWQVPAPGGPRHGLG